MAIRKIRQFGDEILRKKSKPVDKIDDKIRDLIDDMFNTMYEATGVGLAAVQVGILKRVFIVDLGDDPHVFINAEILDSSGEQLDEEGCLSGPGHEGEVKRPFKVTVRACDENGEGFEMEAEELLARAICHEVDHLNGVVFTDHIPGRKKV